MEWEKCKNCFLCFTDEGESGWYCTATNEELEFYDDLPCKFIIEIPEEE